MAVKVFWPVTGCRPGGSATRGAFHLGKTSGWKFRKHSGLEGKAFQPQSLVCNLIARVNQKSKSESNFQSLWQWQQFVAVLLEDIRTDFRELFSTDSILNDKRRGKRKTATAREQRSPANIGNGGKNSRRQSPAHTELRKWLFRKIPGRTARSICI